MVWNKPQKKRPENKYLDNSSKVLGMRSTWYQSWLSPIFGYDSFFLSVFFMCKPCRSQQLWRWFSYWKDIPSAGSMFKKRVGRQGPHSPLGHHKWWSMGRVMPIAFGFTYNTKVGTWNTDWNGPVISETVHHLSKSWLERAYHQWHGTSFVIIRWRFQKC